MHTPAKIIHQWHGWQIWCVVRIYSERIHAHIQALQASNTTTDNCSVDTIRVSKNLEDFSMQRCRFCACCSIGSSHARSRLVITRKHMRHRVSSTCWCVWALSNNLLHQCSI